MAHPYFRPVNFDDIYHKRVPPPFIPTLQSATDTSNFDQEFTREVPVLTPVSSGPTSDLSVLTVVLTPEMQEQFRGFSFVADPDSI
jgi:classical protein kinase C alpha type